jgi:hypothetical protein
MAVAWPSPPPGGPAASATATPPPPWSSVATTTSVVMAGLRATDPGRPRSDLVAVWSGAELSVVGGGGWCCRCGDAVEGSDTCGGARDDACSGYNVARVYNDGLCGLAGRRPRVVVVDLGQQLQPAHGEAWLPTASCALLSALLVWCPNGGAGGSSACWWVRGGASGYTGPLPGEVMRR